MTREEYDKRIAFLFDEYKDHVKNELTVEIVKKRLSRNYNRHNCRVVKCLCQDKLNKLIGIEGKKKLYKIKGE